jgi:hypothetical protein
MPESGQGMLSAQLTALLMKVLAGWQARGQAAPRLAYVTDCGNHPKEYYGLPQKFCNTASEV